MADMSFNFSGDNRMADEACGHRGLVRAQDKRADQWSGLSGSPNALTFRGFRE